MPLPSVNMSGDINFPAEFKFGVADADLQVIGEDQTIAEEGSEPTMWLRFTEAHGLATPGAGIDRYHRWPEDVAQMQKMGVRHYRTSVSMSRTLTRNNQVNQQAIEWYKRYFGAIKEHGISIYATLYHWELPQYLHELGGWTNRATAFVLRQHAQVVAEQLGEFIDEFFILNEPWCSSMLSYYEGLHAPGRQYPNDKDNLKAAVSAAHHLLLAQGLAFEAIKERAPNAQVSTVLNVEPAYTISTNPDDIQAARYRDGYFNTWFLDPTFTGRYPQLMVELYGENTLPPSYEKDLDTIQVGDKLHALGINYYKGGLHRAAGGALRSEEVRVEGGQVNDLGWPIYQPPHYPEGLYDVLQQVYYGYRAFGLRKIYVTENGTALKTPWDGQAEVIDDEPRAQYIQENLRQVHKALLRGVPVEAYFAWTLMDNFEWAEGYRPESAFGLIHVDRDSMARIPKKSALWYSQLLRTHDVAQADS